MRTLKRRLVLFVSVAVLALVVGCAPTEMEPVPTVVVFEFPSQVPSQAEQVSMQVPSTPIVSTTIFVPVVQVSELTLEPVAVPELATALGLGGGDTVADIRIRMLGNPLPRHVPAAEQVLGAFQAAGLALPETGLTLCIVGPDYADPCPVASCGLTCWVASEKGWINDLSGACLLGEGCDIVLRLHSLRCGGAPMPVVLANELAHVACDLAPREGCVGNRVWSPYFVDFCVALGGDLAVCEEWERR